MNLFKIFYKTPPKKELLSLRALKLMLIISVFISSGCKKYIQVPVPITSLSSDNVYASNTTATAVLTGMYAQMIGVNFLSLSLISTSSYCGLSADEFGLYSPSTLTNSYQPFYINSLSNNQLGGNLWTYTYQLIYTANAAIAGLTGNNNLTLAVQQQLLGEAKFMRAFCYFYLVNLYGDVPLVTTTDYTVNGLIARTSKDTVYVQLIADLKDAETLLSTDYLDGQLNTGAARLRPTKWAASALLARTYLYKGDWKDAQTEAGIVIANTGTFSLNSLSNVFLSNSTEAIWQLQSVTQFNTPDGFFFILPSSGPNASHPIYLSNNLLSSFETGDQRLVNWAKSVTTTVGGTPTTYYYPFKYKSNAINAAITEYEMVLRLGEQYLIRAEAEAQLNDLTDAAADLNQIRTRAGLPNTTASTQTALLAAILHERQVELFSEWGHRWFDLKRTQTVDAVMNIVTPQKGGTWNTDAQLYTIPQSEIALDHNLIQNPGY